MNLKEASPQRQWVVRLLQEVRDGSVELLVKRREPVSDPPPRVRKDILLSRNCGRASKPRRRNFALKEPVLKLFEFFDSVDDCVAVSIEVKDGLPFRLQFYV